ncbi:PR-1-like protein [Penicillium verhagenii]|nr:PR-1-like protein [Penicillium verhagenii]
MHLSFLLGILTTLIVLLGTTFADLEACGVLPVTAVTKIVYPTTETTAPQIESTGTTTLPGNADGTDAAYCPNHSGPYRCAHTPELEGVKPPNSTTTHFEPVQTTIGSSASVSQVSISVVGGSSTTFVTRASSSSVVSAVSSTLISALSSAPPSAFTSASSSVSSASFQTSSSASTSSESKTSSTVETSSTVSVPAGYPFNGNYPDKCLYSHNVHRRNHSAPDLMWNQKLADAAHNWAVQCKFAHNTHLLPNGYGQNLAASGPTASISEHISDFWYNGEIEDFESHYGQPNPGGNFDSYGHFTQVIWKGSTSVGCATQDCTSTPLQMWMTVCNYDPPGNFLSQFNNNVMRPKGLPTEKGNGDLIKANSWY